MKIDELLLWLLLGWAIAHTLFTDHKPVVNVYLHGEQLEPQEEQP